jgi:DNA-binding CsgD family transcriptional regulator
VLACRPCEPESNLSFAGLGDLLEGTLPAAALPASQRRALEAALRLEESEEHRIDRHSVGAGILSLLRQLSLEAPVLIAVDDCQWLDTPSARSLAFAFRRLREERVGLLLAARSRSTERAEELFTAAPEARAETVDVGPLTRDEIMRIVASRHGQPISPRELERVAGVADGNPFVALAAADALRRHGELAPGDLPSIPVDVRRLFDGALDAASDEARDALLAAALSARPTLDAIAGATRLDARRVEVVVADLARFNLARVRDRELRFEHPAVAAAVRERAEPAKLRAMHRRLAEVAPAGSEARAYHLALGAESTDAGWAREIDLAAQGAARRGAPESAAELSQLAAGITPAADERARLSRQLRAAEHHHHAGDLRSARRLAEVVFEGRDPECRARAILLLAELAWLDRNGPRAVELGERALREASGPELRLEAHTRLAYLCHADRERGLAHANQAVELLESVPAAGTAIRARARFAVVYNEVDLGRPLRWEIAHEAVELEAASPPPRVSERLSFLLGICLMQRDALDRARPLMEDALAAAIERGDDGSLPMIHDQLFQLEWLAGRWGDAREHVDEHLRLASQLGQEVELVWAFESRALITAHLGDLAAARTDARVALERAQALRDGSSLGYIHRTLGFIALSECDARAADSAFSAADEIAEHEGLRSVGGLRHHADHIEALVELGEVDRAAGLLARLSDRARDEGSPWGAAAASRCRALVAAARGNLEAAAVAIDDALAACDAVPIPFELGRTLLAQGMIHRRRKQKRRAGAALRRASQIFETLGARGWAARAERERARVGVRPPAPETLTESERRVVDLVRRGLANREVAAQLFISEKTVEGVLTRAYRKMGVRGRAELMAVREPAAATEPLTAGVDAARG